MPKMDLGQMIALLGSGSLLTAFGAMVQGWLKARSDAKLAEARVRSEIDLATDAQEFNQQSRIIDDLRRRIESLEKANADCIKDRSELRYQVGHLEGRLDEQNKTMQHMRSSSEEQNREAVKTAGELAAEGVKVAAQLVAAASDSAIRLATSQIGKSDPESGKLTVVDMESIH